MECRIAIVGAGIFAHNISKVFSNESFSLKYIVDEFKKGDYLGAPVIAAADLSIEKQKKIDKYVIAISTEEYRIAAIDRLAKQGVRAEKIFPIDDDPSIPILQLIFSRYFSMALPYFVSEQCTDMYSLERYCFGETWESTLNRLDPSKKTLAFGFYGRGGGFRRHLGGLIEPLKSQYNVIALMDEEVSGYNFEVPELLIGPTSARNFNAIDACLTAHFIACSPENKPKLNMLHTSFDFILEPGWIADRFDTADPHYIFTSTRATFEWMQDLVKEHKPKGRICLIPGGYTRLDDNLKHAESYQGKIDSIIYAPTLSLNAVANYELTYSSPYSLDIVTSLLNNFPEKNIIFRPHPNDLTMLLDGRNDKLAEPFIKLLELCDSEPRLILDGMQTFYMDSYNRSSVMVSDTSSTAYTYSLSTLRPVVFFSPKDKEVTTLYSKHSAFIRDREKIGKVASDTYELVKHINEMLTNQSEWKEKIQQYRSDVCFNIRKSEQYLVENMHHIINNTRHDDWLYYNW
ncbi:CDP-glycerol glycerophosphotransferase family protein [Aliagarivorans marinus]|uniref:CDP-glycerol glycerophosphotransferase family protein n=1 Tax=Aliagarivorans marinus TaxID=561965 RepID=UPI000407627A|nr:CDP-glycerol glycerophosphotransferase family protein [Aliagarivorans marinus]